MRIYAWNFCDVTAWPTLFKVTGLFLWVIFFYTLIQYNHRQHLHSQKILAKEEQHYRQQLNHPIAIREQLQHENNTLKQLQDQLCHYKHTQNLMESLNLSAKNSQTSLQSVQISAQSMQNQLIEQTITLQIQGHYRDLFSFLIQSAKQTPTMTIQNMDIQKNGRRKLIAIITLQALFPEPSVPDLC